MTEKHEKNGQKICPYCDYKIKEIQSLKYHIDTKHSVHAEKKFFCDICKKGFMFKSIFSSHQGVHKASLKGQEISKGIYGVLFFFHKTTIFVLFFSPF